MVQNKIIDTMWDESPVDVTQEANFIWSIANKLEGLSQNQDFFALLLNNEEIKRQILGIFTDEIYKSLRE